MIFTVREREGRREEIAGVAEEGGEEQKAPEVVGAFTFLEVQVF